MLFKVLVHLPTIFFLTSATLLAEQLHFFKAFDEEVIAFVASLKMQPALDLPAEVDADAKAKVVAIIISRSMFETELGRQLPIDRDRLAKVVAAIVGHQPRLLAIDVDALPSDLRESPPDVSHATQNQAANASPPILKEIVRALEKGVSVLAITYPRTGDTAKQVLEAQRARTWQRFYCDVASRVESTRSGTTGEPGKLWWASPALNIEGRSLSAIYYTDTGTAIQNAGRDAMLPLGIVLSAASSEPVTQEARSIRLRADHCRALLASDAAPTESREKMLEPKAGHGHDERSGHDKDRLINYFNDDVRQVTIDSISDLDDAASLLEGKTVVLGVDSFGGVDRHTTPIGQLPGAVIHALIATSIAKPVSTAHARPFALDIVVGMVFVALFTMLEWLRERWADKLKDMPTIANLLDLGIPMVVPIVVVLMILATLHFTARGIWINPLPMLFGLVIHLYVEVVKKEHVQDGHDDHKSAWFYKATWQKNCVEFWDVVTGSTPMSRLAYLDFAVRCLVVISMWFVTAKALVSLLGH